MEYNMIFVLGYDLLHDKLSSNKLSCDEAFSVCVDVYESFLQSKENTLDMSEYDALKEYIENNDSSIDYLIEVACRNLEPSTPEVSTTRMVQHYSESENIWCYYVKDVFCDCGCNCFSHEFDKEKNQIYGVCNGCSKDVYTIRPECMNEDLSKGIWLPKQLSKTH